MECEHRNGKRFLKVRTWSGNEEEEPFPDLKDTRRVCHCIGFRNYRSYPVFVDIEGEILKPREILGVRFVPHPNLDIAEIDRDSAHRWTCKNFAIQKRKKGWWPWQKEVKNEFVVLEANGNSGPQVVSTYIKTELKFGERGEEFTLDITVNS